MSLDSLDSYFIASADYQDDTPIVKVKGNLKLNVAFWEHLGAYRFIRDTTVDGCKIPFIYTPPSAHFTNNRSAIVDSDFGFWKAAGLRGSLFAGWATDGI